MIKETTAHIVAKVNMEEGLDVNRNASVTTEEEVTGGGGGGSVEQTKDETIKQRIAWWARTDRRYRGNQLLRQRAQLNLLKQEQDRAKSLV
jgi:hypothetical protein